jgi:hypothetical protein
MLAELRSRPVMFLELAEGKLATVRGGGMAFQDAMLYEPEAVGRHSRPRTRAKASPRSP